MKHFLLIAFAVMFLAAAPAPASTIGKADMICAVCGETSSQIYFSSFSLPPMLLDLDLMPNLGVVENMYIKECPHCGYLAHGNLNEGASPEIKLIVEGQAYRKLIRNQEKEAMRFLPMLMLDEAAGRHYEAGLDCVAAAWMLDIGNDRLEKEQGARDRYYSRINKRQQDELDALEGKKTAEEDQAWARAKEGEWARQERMIAEKYEALEKQLRQKQADQRTKSEYALTQPKGRHSKQAAELRRQAVGYLEKAVAADEDGDADLAVEDVIAMNYLLAEMYRRTGDFESAASQIKQCRAIIAKSHVDKKEMYEEEEKTFLMLMQKQEELIAGKDQGRAAIDLQLDAWRNEPLNGYDQE